MTTAGGPGTAPLRAAVWDALGHVRDPELDEPLTELGFVAGCDVDPSGAARVRLRLPTYFCAPNFAYLMVADARGAVLGVPGITGADVTLVDHFAGGEINDGVAGERGFVGTFGDLATAELAQLRADFARKAVLAATDRACEPLLAAGRSVADLATMALGDAPRGRGRDRLQAHRADLALPAGLDAPLVVDPVSGEAVEGPALAMFLHRCRLTRVSAEANGELCRGRLRERYPEVHLQLRGRSGEVRTPGSRAPGAGGAAATSPSRTGTST